MIMIETTNQIDLISMAIEKCKTCLNSGLYLFPRDLKSNDTDTEVLLNIALDYLEDIEKNFNALSDTIISTLKITKR